jgi:hypothetical protein
MISPTLRSNPEWIATGLRSVGRQRTQRINVFGYRLTGAFRHLLCSPLPCA